MGTNPVMAYYNSVGGWTESLIEIHHLLLSLGFSSAFKWGRPVYQLENKNLIGVSKHQSFLTLMFFQGALLKDEHNRLVNAQEGKTKAMRQWRFYNPSEIDISQLSSYFLEVKDLASAGLEILPEKTHGQLMIPELLQKAIDEDDELQSAFSSMTMFKQKEFAEYISDAKRVSTQLRRLEKILPMIKRQEGLHDKYRG